VIAKNTTATTAGDGRRGPGRPRGSKAHAKKWKKPYPTFPLTLHQTGQFCKKIHGKIKYFGKDQEAALRLYREQCEGLHSGKSTEVRREGAVTVGAVVSHFLTVWKAKQESGEIAARTFMDYYRHGSRLVKFFGKSMAVDSITREDFDKLRQHLARNASPVTLKGRVGAIRTMFELAYSDGLIAAPLKRDWLKRPSRKQLRKARSESGRNYFFAEEIQRLLQHANTHFRAMILLGVNCGLGNTDIAALPRNAIDLKGGFVDFARIKTGVPRRCPLWPETIRAIEAHIAEDTIERSPETKGLLFVTRNGQRYVRSVFHESDAGLPQLVEHDAIVNTFKRLMAEAGVDLPGVAFYGLRHSCETFGGETGEQVAVDHIMGHAPDSNDMGDNYRGYVAESSLRRVTDHVRSKVIGVKGRRRAAI
jgi:integrase